MKQTEDNPVNTNKPGMQPNAPPPNAQEKQQHRHTDDQGKTPPSKPQPPDAVSK